MYLFSSSSSAQWQQIAKFGNYAYGQLKLSDTIFFMLGSDPSSYDLHFYKLSFGSLSPEFSLKLACTLGTWVTNYSESFLISSSIYSFFLYQKSGTTYAYMITISATDGSVSNRYKSSISWVQVFGSAVSGDNIVISVRTTSPCSLVIFNIAIHEFTIRSFSGNFIYGIGFEPVTNRYNFH